MDYLTRLLAVFYVLGQTSKHPAAPSYPSGNKSGYPTPIEAMCPGASILNIKLTSESFSHTLE